MGLQTEVVGKPNVIKRSSNSTATPQSSPTKSHPPEMSKRKRYVTICLLVVVNLLNYMDRYTIAGILQQVQDYYNITDGPAGLLQSAFLVGFSITAPIFGYYGDRYNRKWLMISGIVFWSAVTLTSSFIPSEYFWLFVLMRSLVGVGEASYVTIAPTLISDLFVGKKRSLMLMLFYFAVPIGSGLGYIAGANLALINNEWQWSLRLTPIVGVVCCILLAAVAQEPHRGMAEEGVSHKSTSPIKEDLVALAKIKTLPLITIGSTCVNFASGSIALFGPKFLFLGYRITGDYEVQQNMVSLYTGIVTVASGFLSVGLGGAMARLVKKRHQNGDALVCAFGLLSCTPFMFGVLVVSEYNMIAVWVLMLSGQTLLFTNWAVVDDILLYTVPATRRASAESIQVFVCHLLGDAASPYIIGAVSDAIRRGRVREFYSYRSLQQSMFINFFITIIGGGAYLLSSFYIVQDRKNADRITKGIVEGSSTEVKLNEQTEMTRL